MGNRDFALDKVIAVIILCIGLSSIAASLMLKHYAIQLPLIISVSSLLYLLFRGKLSQIESLPAFIERNRIRSLSHIIFIISLSLSICLLWSNLYYRPPLYFALLLVAAASIILDIFCLNEEKSAHTFIALSKIIALSLITYAGMYYQFPGIYGVDPWLHSEWIKETVSLGHITQGEFITNGYYLFPVFHLTAAMTQILTSLSTYSSVFASTGVFMAMSCLFVFLIARKLINTQAGLLAALIVPLTADFIERATAIIAMSLGFCFFLAILYLVFCRDEKKSLRYSGLIVILSVSLILTHTIAALVTLLSLMAVFAGIKWYKRISKPAMPYEAVSLSLITFFGVAMLLRWMQDPLWGPSFFTWNLSYLAESLRTGSQFVLTTFPAPTNIPYAVSLLDQGGFLLLLAFGIIGALIYFHARNRTGPRMALILVVAVLVALPYGFMLFKLENILPGRWFIFLYVPLAILAVQGLLGVSRLIRPGLGKLSLIMVAVLAILCMMTTTNSMANDDSPFLYNGAARIGYTQSELTAIKTLSDMEVGCPKTDMYYGYIFPYVVGYEPYTEMVERDSSVFIVRSYYLHHPEWNEKYNIGIHEGGIGNYEREKAVMDYMKEQGIDKGNLIYSTGNVKAYIIPKS